MSMNFSLDPTDFVKILNGIAIGLAALLVIAFVVGIFRKFWRNTLNLLIFIGLLVVIFFTINPLLDWFLALRLQSIPLVGSFIPASFNLTISGTSVPISTSTVELTLRQMIESYYTANGLSVAESPDFSNYAYGLALVFARYALYSLLVTLAIIITPIIMLLFRLIGLLFPKKKKIRIFQFRRLFGAAFNTIRVAIVGLAILIPFTSFANTVARAFSDPSNAEVNENANGYTDIKQMSDAYFDSFLYKTLFGWSANGDGETFDTTLMNMMTDGEYNGQPVSLTTEITTLAGIGKTVLSSGIGTEDFDYNDFFTPEVINSLFANIENSNLMVSYMPIFFHGFFSAADNPLVSDSFRPFFAHDVLGFDYDQELESMKQLLLDLIEGDAINSIYQVYADETAGNAGPTAFYDAIFAPSLKGTMTNVLSQMGSSPFISGVFSNFFYAEATKSTGTSNALTLIFPNDYEEFSAQNWAHELKEIYQAFAEMYGLDSDVGAVLSGDQSNLTWDDFVKDNADDFKSILGGDYNAVTGDLENYDTNNFNYSTGSSALFDSDLLMKNAKPFLAYIFADYIAASPVNATVFNLAVDSWDDSDLAVKRLNYKNGISDLLDLVTVI